MLSRPPYVAGRFYPETEQALLEELEQCIPVSASKENAIGILAPHAGYLYSGRVAGEVYSRINVPETAVLFCPNHTGFPVDFSVWASGQWETPLGNVVVDEKLARLVLDQCPGAEEDTMAHRDEHAIEVHLPFLQILNPEVQIVPVVVRSSSLEAFKKFGHGLAEAIRLHDRQTLIVASSDMSHFESHESSKAKDKLAIDCMLEMDEDGLYQTVHDHSITMCGYGPASIMMSAARDLGASSSELVRYATSGEVSGDYEKVVGYAGMIVK